MGHKTYLPSDFAVKLTDPSRNPESTGTDTGHPGPLLPAPENTGLKAPFEEGGASCIGWQGV